MSPLCGVLALQGSFSCHARVLSRLGVACREVRRPSDLAAVTHLILPGGESTTLHKLGELYGLLDAIHEASERGIALFGTCAGAILLGQGGPPPPRLGLVPVEVVRNAYGRQKESFTADLSLSFANEHFRGVFIRAPKIEPPGEGQGVEILSTWAGTPVMVRYGRVLVATFHPELTEDDRVHRFFLSM